jgi:hypothetical protein
MRRIYRRKVTELCCEELLLLEMAGSRRRPSNRGEDVDAEAVRRCGDGDDEAAVE